MLKSELRLGDPPISCDVVASLVYDESSIPVNEDDCSKSKSARATLNIRPISSPSASSVPRTLMPINNVALTSVAPSPSSFPTVPVENERIRRVSVVGATIATRSQRALRRPIAARIDFTQPLRFKH